MLWKKASNHIEDIAAILSQEPSREELLGMKAVKPPTADEVIADAASLSNYSTSQDYKKFVEQVWGRVIMHLDKILDERSSHELIKFHCGALKESLDLLRLSYQARSVLEQEASDPSHR